MSRVVIGIEGFKVQSRSEWETEGTEGTGEIEETGETEENGESCEWVRGER